MPVRKCTHSPLRKDDWCTWDCPICLEKSFLKLQRRANLIERLGLRYCTNCTSRAEDWCLTCKVYMLKEHTLQRIITTLRDDTFQVEILGVHDPMD